MDDLERDIYNDLMDLKQQIDLKVKYPNLYQWLVVLHQRFENKKQQSKINETTQQKEYAAS